MNEVKEALPDSATPQCQCSVLPRHTDHVVRRNDASGRSVTPTAA